MPYVIAPILLAVGTAVLGWWMISVGMLVIGAYMAFFFRNPERRVPIEKGIIVAPADGKVTLIKRAKEDDRAESLVSIFLSPLDVHVNRSPIAGEVVDIVYNKGKFLMATNAQARLLNEQNTLVIQGAEVTVKCTQIAGILARRIVCWKRAGESVECGERFGMIKFGSRTDLVLPASVEILIKEGMHVKGGETIVGRIRE